MDLGNGLSNGRSRDILTERPVKDRNSPPPPAALPAPLPLGPPVRTLLPLLLLAAACAPKVPRMPGPLSSVGRDAPPVAVLRPLEVLEAVEPLPAPERRRRDPELGGRIAAAAEHYLEHRPHGFRDDCSGFVSAALDRAGLPLQGSTRSLWETLQDAGRTHRRKRPELGDLAFFDNTYDRDRDGRFDDELTHIGVVIAVDDDDTITIAHAGTSKGRTTLTMNLREPDVRRTDDGTVRNDYLRRRSDRDPKGAVYLAGELWRGFATLDDDALADGR